jgi:ATP-dependent protease ClpP protease subunit
VTSHAVTPMYRYRGTVMPSAEVARPVAVHRTPAAAATEGKPAAGSATLDIFDVIDSYGGWWGISARDVDAALKAAGEIGTLYVRLNSPGGDASEGVAIANLLRAHAADVRVTVYGIAASAASVIAIAGSTVSMAPGSILMIHEASDITWGDAAEMRKAAAALDAVSDGYASLYALKAGGDSATWRETMRAETWYPAEAAVTAKLADAVGIDPHLPPDLTPVEPDTDEPVEVDVQVTVNPAARAAARRFDLSMFSHAPAALTGAKTPADQPVTPPTDHKEADTMSDTIPTAGLVKALGLPGDADEDAILEAVEAKVSASTASPEITDEAIAQAHGVTAEQVKAALAGAKAGKATVSQSYLDTLEANAKLGADARAKQLADERDEAIQAKVAAGIISRDQVESWRRDWDRDPASAKAELDKLTVPRFPVGDAPGHGGDGAQASYTAEMAAQDAELFGLPQEAFTR